MVEVACFTCPRLYEGCSPIWVYGFRLVRVNPTAVITLCFPITRLTIPPLSATVQLLTQLCGKSHVTNPNTLVAPAKFVINS